MMDIVSKWMFFPQQNSTAISRTDVLKQIRELFELKEMGAISAQEYEDKKKIIMKDL